MRISEAAGAAGMTTKTLRFYEEQGLLPAVERAPNGYRKYTQEAVSRLEFIRRGRLAGLALAQIGDILSVHDAGQSPCAHVRDSLARQMADLDVQIAELTALRATVAEFHRAAVVGDPSACDPQRICSYL